MTRPSNAILSNVIGFAAVIAVVALALCGILLLADVHRASVDLRRPTFTTIRPTAPEVSAERPEGKYGYPSEGGVPRPGFTTKLNGRTHQPDWVLWKVDPRGVVDRAKFPWTNDPNVPAANRQRSKAYEGAHWRADGVMREAHSSSIQRGHLKDAASSRRSDETMRACMVLDDNIIPELASLNQGPMARLEAYIRKLGEGTNVDVFCVTGPVWSATAADTFTVQTLDDGTWIPVAVFKSILIVQEDGDIEIKSWLLANTPDTPQDYDEDAIETDEVERMAGVDVWNKVDRILQEKLESIK